MRRGGSTVAGVGIGWRPEIASNLLASPRTADFVEVVAESCFVQPRARREAIALASVWPVVPHGVKLSLGSADGVDLSRAKTLGRFARELRAPAITEHVAFTRAGGREIGHLTQLPRTRDAIEALRRNVAKVRRVLPDVPLLLENVAWSFQWPDDAMTEGEFYAEVVRATGCDLLLDLGNLYANAANAGVDPVDALRSYPLDRVAMLHIAGGVFEDGFYFDTHAHAIPDAVFALLAVVFEAVGPVPTVLERDAKFPPFAHLADELARVRALSPRAPLHERLEEPNRDAAFEMPANLDALADSQRTLAHMLTDAEAPVDVGRFDRVAVARARDILQRKRVDDALPLLPFTHALGADIEPLAIACIRAAPRAPRMAGIHDAFSIASMAISDPRFAHAAARDRLALRTRFAGLESRGAIRPRHEPFVARERLADGTALWALKGPGASAPVRVFTRKGSST